PEGIGDEGAFPVYHAVVFRSGSGEGRVMIQMRGRFDRARLVGSCVLLMLPLGSALAQNTGLVPLIDLGPGIYKGYPGGLYPGGVNYPPVTHESAAMQM